MNDSQSPTSYMNTQLGFPHKIDFPKQVNFFAKIDFKKSTNYTYSKQILL